MFAASEYAIGCNGESVLGRGRFGQVFAVADNENLAVKVSVCVKANVSERVCFESVCVFALVCT